MRILQICPAKLPLIDDNGIIYGGAERFCLDFAKLQQEAGNEITSIVHEGTCVSRVSGNCTTLNLRISNDLVELAKGYDVVVYHLVGQSGLNALSKAEIPVLMIWHMSLMNLGISKFGLFTAIENNRRVGGKLLGVSKTIQKQLNNELQATYNWCYNRGDYANKYLDILSTISCDYGDILQYVNSKEKLPEVLPSNGRGFVLSQLSKIRDPYLILNILKSDVDYFVSYTDKMNDYVQLFLKEAEPYNDNVFYNLKYDDIQNSIRNYKFLINPCVSETAGYSVFESAIKGVPCILFSDSNNEHASAEFFDDIGVKKIKSKENRKRISIQELTHRIKNAIQDIPDNIEYRQSIQDHIKNKFTEQRVLDIYNQIFKILGSKGDNI